MAGFREYYCIAVYVRNTLWRSLKLIHSLIMIISFKLHFSVDCV